MSDPEGSTTTFGGEAVKAVAAILLGPRQHAELPLPQPSAKPTQAAEAVDISGPISTHAEVLALTGPEDWQALHERFAGQKKTRRPGNLKPWFRCLGVLRGLDAKCVVIETHYVCLDYKSEYAAFYAHIDEPRSAWTVRLHFFGEPVPEERIVDLRGTDPQPDLRKSYLGYVVCREGDLPLVGRCLIETPSYIVESTAVIEKVSFFGQSLQVRGVPFMQQDQRFSNCAHVAAWTIAYTAFRRGINERRLIADLVGLTGPLQPLRPRALSALSERQVALMLSDLGFRTTNHLVPNPAWLESSLPPIAVTELPSSLRDRYKQIVGLGSKGQQDAVAGVLEAVEKYLESLRPPGTSGGVDADQVDPQHPTLLLLNGLLDHLLRPYIRSGWPVYLGTRDHALVLCGRSEVAGEAVHFVHDDQNGPYLLASSLPTLSREGLRFQSGLPVEIGGSASEAYPPSDRILEAWPDGDAGVARLRAAEMHHAIHALVVTTPARVLLPARAARKRAAAVSKTFSPTPKQLEGTDLSEDERLLADPAVEILVTVMTGTDYKRQRRRHCLSGAPARPEGLTAFSAVQLAEWVVVVEGVHGPAANRQALWDIVFDASSSEQSPRLQLVRMLGTLITTFPRNAGQVEVTDMGSGAFPLLTVPPQVAKVSDETDTSAL